jgi:hypothetical protein
MNLGTDRYQSNAAALPAGAKRAGELMQRELKQQEAGPVYYDPLHRMIRADSRGDFALVGVLIEEARGLVGETGGAA